MRWIVMFLLALSIGGCTMKEVNVTISPDVDEGSFLMMSLDCSGAKLSTETTQDANADIQPPDIPVEVLP